MTTGNAQTATRLDHFMPEWHFREYHSMRIDAPAEVVMRAAREVTWQEAPVARFFLLFTRNKLSADSRIVDDFAGEGNQVLALTDDELVYGGIGCDKGPIELDRPMSEVYRAFDEPGWKKVGFNLRYAGGELSTETRIFATDPESKKEFARYWTIIRVPSGLIRTALLRAVRKRALAMTSQG